MTATASTVAGLAPAAAASGGAHPQLARRCLAWSATAGAVFAIAVFTGWGLDELLWWISFDYVYEPGRFLADARRHGPWAAAVAAAAAACGARPPASLRTILVALAIWLTCLAVLSGLGAGLGWLSVRAGMVAPTPTLIPLGRIGFCDGVVRGALSGTVLGGALLTVVLIRGRGCRPLRALRTSAEAGR